MFKMEFSTSNGIFEEDDIAEVSRLLNKVSEQVAAGSDSGSIIDLNGNVVGEWSLEFDREEPDEFDSTWNLYEDEGREVWSGEYQEWFLYNDVIWDKKKGDYIPF